MDQTTLESIIYCCKRNNLEAIKGYVQMYPELTTKVHPRFGREFTSTTLALIAIELSNFDVVKFILSRSKDVIYHIDDSDLNCIETACLRESSTDKTKTVSEILRLFPSIVSDTKCYLWSVYKCAIDGDIDTLNVLLQSCTDGIFTNPMNLNGFTILHQLVSTNCDVDVMGVILNNREVQKVIPYQTRYGNTALDLCILYANKELLHCFTTHDSLYDFELWDPRKCLRSSLNKARILGEEQFNCIQDELSILFLKWSAIKIPADMLIQSIHEKVYD